MELFLTYCSIQFIVQLLWKVNYSNSVNILERWHQLVCNLIFSPFVLILAKQSVKKTINWSSLSLATVYMFCLSNWQLGGLKKSFFEISTNLMYIRYAVLTSKFNILSFSDSFCLVYHIRISTRTLVKLEPKLFTINSKLYIYNLIFLS